MQKLIKLIEKNINSKTTINNFEVIAKKFKDNSGYEIICREIDNNPPAKDGMPKAYIAGYDISKFKYGKLGYKTTKVSIVLLKEDSFPFIEKSLKEAIIVDMAVKIIVPAMLKAFKERFK